MIDDLLKFYLLEGLGRQVLKKIPYYLMIALIVYFSILAIDLKPVVNPNWLLIPSISLLIFVISTFHFQSRMNGGLRKAYGGLDFKSAVGKIRSVYEGQSSILEDVNLNKLSSVFVSALLNGFSLLIGMVSAFVLALLFSGVGLVIPLLAAFFGTIYLVVDVSKGSLVEEPESKNDNPLATDFFEKYVVTNSVRRLPRRLSSRSFMYVAGRLIGPLVQVNIPKSMYDILLVYHSNELVEVIKGMSQKREGSGLYLKQDAGDTVEQFLADNANVPDRITVLVEQSAMKVFPYLLDPNYPESDKPKKGWMSMQVVDTHTDRIVGRLFAHRFRSVFVKTVFKQERARREEKMLGAYQFLLMGERGYMQYVKTQIEFNSAKVPPEVLRIEVEP